MKKKEWIAYFWNKNGNDGRRESAIGQNHSVQHLKERDALYTLCGLEIKHEFHKPEDSKNGDRKCKKCLKQVIN